MVNSEQTTEEVIKKLFIYGICFSFQKKKKQQQQQQEYVFLNVPFTVVKNCRL